LLWLEEEEERQRETKVGSREPRLLLSGVVSRLERREETELKTLDWEEMEEAIELRREEVSDGAYEEHLMSKHPQET
jgi:hypothetical protein